MKKKIRNATLMCQKRWGMFLLYCTIHKIIHFTLFIAVETI